VRAARGSGWSVASPSTPSAGARPTSSSARASTAPASSGRPRSWRSTRRGRCSSSRSRSGRCASPESQAGSGAAGGSPCPCSAGRHEGPRPGWRPVSRLQDWPSSALREPLRPQPRDGSTRHRPGFAHAWPLPRLEPCASWEGMRATRIGAAGPEELGKLLAVRDVELSGRRAGEVLVRPAACGVSRNCLSTVSGEDPFGSAPTAPGREVAGVRTLPPPVYGRRPTWCASKCLASCGRR
jgi:hypothetical protein